MRILLYLRAALLFFCSLEARSNLLFREDDITLTLREMMDILERLGECQLPAPLLLIRVVLPAPLAPLVLCFYMPRVVESFGGT